ncbi:hypothetical protein ERD95_12525 [Enterobacteriaceae bacterium ML5]|nr:hypothetical protein ERD95_12525 [Enterobacteriaceae bacterium ML5]
MNWLIYRNQSTDAVTGKYHNYAWCNSFFEARLTIPSSILDVTVQLPDGEPKLFHFLTVNILINGIATVELTNVDTARF